MLVGKKGRLAAVEAENAYPLVLDRHLLGHGQVRSLREDTKLAIEEVAMCRSGKFQGKNEEGKHRVLKSSISHWGS